MDLHQRAKAAIDGPAGLVRRERPTEKPLGLFRPHVDAPMTHRRAKVLMPVRAVEGMPLRSKEARPGNTR